MKIIKVKSNATSNPMIRQWVLQGPSTRQLAAMGKGEDVKTRENVNHTPGPWSTKEGHDVIIKMQITGHELIASCGVKWLTKNGKYQEACANARLIAAAPELLEACKQARTHYKALFTQTSWKDSGILELIEKAIEKAEGRES